MAQALSRQVLCDLVWSMPLKQLCERFGISDVALKKSCAKSDIPTPERGYWARKRSRKECPANSAAATRAWHGR